MIRQAELDFIFGIGTFITGLFTGSLSGITGNVNHTCPLLETGQFAFGGSQFTVDDVDSFVDKLGSLRGYFILVIIPFFVIQFHQLVQEISAAGYLAVCKT